MFLCVHGNLRNYTNCESDMVKSPVLFRVGIIPAINHRTDESGNGTNRGLC